MPVKFQKALREMFVIGLILGIALLCSGEVGTDAKDILACFVLGIMLSPIGWSIYRLIRFMIVPIRSASLE